MAIKPPTTPPAIATALLLAGGNASAVGVMVGVVPVGVMVAVLVGVEVGVVVGEVKPNRCAKYQACSQRTSTQWSNIVIRPRSAERDTSPEASSGYLSACN